MTTNFRKSGVFSETCYKCQKRVVTLERVEIEGKDKVVHKSCFVCETCGCQLFINNFETLNSSFYCTKHFILTKRNSTRIEGFNFADNPFLQMNGNTPPVEGSTSPKAEHSNNVLSPKTPNSKPVTKAAPLPSPKFGTKPGEKEQSGVPLRKSFVKSPPPKSNNDNKIIPQSNGEISSNHIVSENHHNNSNSEEKNNSISSVDSTESTQTPSISSSESPLQINENHSHCSNNNVPNENGDSLKSEVLHVADINIPPVDQQASSHSPIISPRAIQKHHPGKIHISIQPVSPSSSLSGNKPNVSINEDVNHDNIEINSNEDKKGGIEENSKIDIQVGERKEDDVKSNNDDHHHEVGEKNENKSIEVNNLDENNSIPKENNEISAEIVNIENNNNNNNNAAEIVQSDIKPLAEENKDENNNIVIINNNDNKVIENENAENKEPNANESEKGLEESKEEIQKEVNEEEQKKEEELISIENSNLPKESDNIISINDSNNEANTTNNNNNDNDNNNDNNNNNNNNDENTTNISALDVDIGGKEKKLVRSQSDSKGKKFRLRSPKSPKATSSTHTHSNEILQTSEGIVQPTSPESKKKKEKKPKDRSPDSKEGKEVKKEKKSKKTKTERKEEREKLKAEKRAERKERKERKKERREKKKKEEEEKKGEKKEGEEVKEEKKKRPGLFRMVSNKSRSLLIHGDRKYSTPPSPKSPKKTSKFQKANSTTSTEAFKDNLCQTDPTKIVLDPSIDPKKPKITFEDPKKAKNDNKKVEKKGNDPNSPVIYDPVIKDEGKDPQNGVIKVDESKAHSSNIQNENNPNILNMSVERKISNEIGKENQYIMDDKFGAVKNNNDNDIIKVPEEIIVIEKKEIEKLEDYATFVKKAPLDLTIPALPSSDSPSASFVDLPLMEGDILSFKFLQENVGMQQPLIVASEEKDPLYVLIQNINNDVEVAQDALILQVEKGLSSYRKIRFALLGLNDRILAIVASVLSNYPHRVSIIGIYDPSPALVQKALLRFGDVKSCSSEEELMALKNIDWVLIGTHNLSHNKSIKLCLSHKKNIFCENPVFGSKVDEVHELLENIKSHHQQFATAHPLRYSPFFSKVFSLLSSGEFGNIVSINFVQSLTSGETSHLLTSENRYRNKIGSMVVEKCYSTIGILNWLVRSMPMKVASFAGMNVFRPSNQPPQGILEKFKEYKAEVPLNPFLTDSDLEDNVASIIEYMNNTRVTFHLFCNAPSSHQEITINCMNGIIEGLVSLHLNKHIIIADDNDHGDYVNGTISAHTISSGKTQSFKLTGANHGQGNTQKLVTNWIENHVFNNSPPPYEDFIDSVVTSVTTLMIDQSHVDSTVIDLSHFWNILGIIPV